MERRRLERRLDQSLEFGKRWGVKSIGILLKTKIATSSKGRGACCGDDGFGMDVGSDGEYFLGHGVAGFEFILSEQGSSPSAVSCGSVWQPTTRDSIAAQQHLLFSNRSGVSPGTVAIKS